MLHHTSSSFAREDCPAMNPHSRHRPDIRQPRLQQLLPIRASTATRGGGVRRRRAAARRRGGAARGRPGRDTTSWCQTRSSRRWRSYSALGTTRCLCPRVRGGNRAAAHRCAAGRSTPADDVLPGVRPATLQFFVALTLAMAVDDGPGRASARGGRGGHLRMDTHRGIQPTRFHDHERISLHTG